MTTSIGEEGGTGLNKLYQALARTRVEDASASHKEEKMSVLRLVEEGPGFRALNLKVNQLLREWVREVISETLHKYELHHAIKSKDAHAKEYYTEFLTNIGDLYVRHNEHIEALQCYTNALMLTIGRTDERMKCDTKTLYFPKGIWKSEEPGAALYYNKIGFVMFKMGHHDESLANFENCLQIRGADPEQIAQAHYGMGCVLAAKFDHEKAHRHHCKALALRQTIHDSNNHLDIAESYHQLSSCLNDMGDLDRALDYAFQCLAIRKQGLHHQHPDIAASYGSIGCYFYNKGNAISTTKAML